MIAPRRRKLGSTAVGLFAVALLAACERGQGSTEETVRVETTILGDTTIVRSSGMPPVVRPDTVLVLWRSDALERPRSMARVGDRLVVGDGTRVHLVPLDGDAPVSVGGEGEGPGEYRAIAAVGVLGDTILVYDARVMRLSRLSADGAYLASRQITPRVPFVNISRGGEMLVPLGDGVLAIHEENVNLVRPIRRAVLEHALAADSSHVVGAWDGAHWTRIGELIGPRELFPARAILAVAADGRIAYGNALDYCISVSRPAQPAVRRVCRDWQRAQVGDGIRSPDLALLEDERSRQVLESLLRDQQIGPLLPSFDALRFGADGTLWVRTVGDEMSHVHPLLAARVAGAGPERRRWDVFDAEGRLVRTVELPTPFDPRVFGDGRIWGIMELPSGELTIAEARR